MRELDGAVEEGSAAVRQCPKLTAPASARWASALFGFRATGARERCDRVARAGGTEEGDRGPPTVRARGGSIENPRRGATPRPRRGARETAARRQGFIGGRHRHVRVEADGLVERGEGLGVRRLASRTSPSGGAETAAARVSSCMPGGGIVCAGRKPPPGLGGGERPG